MDFISQILKEAKKRLVENDEASKNLSVEAVQQVSETLDLLKSNVDQAISKLEIISGQDVSMTKLQGLSAQIDSSITTVAEIIADLTGVQTTEQEIGIVEEDVEMSSDDALKNIDKVKKLASADVNVVIDDSQKRM